MLIGNLQPYKKRESFGRIDTRQETHLGTWPQRS